MDENNVKLLLVLESLVGQEERESVDRRDELRNCKKSCISLQILK